MQTNPHFSMKEKHLHIFAAVETQRIIPAVSRGLHRYVFTLGMFKFDIKPALKDT